MFAALGVAVEDFVQAALMVSAAMGARRRTELVLGAATDDPVSQQEAEDGADEAAVVLALYAAPGGPAFPVVVSFGFPSSILDNSSPAILPKAQYPAGGEVAPPRQPAVYAALRVWGF